MALVRHGSSIHPQGKSTVPPLTYVLTTKPHLSAIQCLLQLGCNPNATTWLGLTAIDAAVQTRNVEALQLLLSAGLDVPPSMSGNNSLLYKAICCRQNGPSDLTLCLIELFTGHEISGKGNPPKYHPREPILAASAHNPKYRRDSWTPFLKLFPERPSLFIGLFLNAKDASIRHEVQDADQYLSMAFSLLDHGASLGLDVHREIPMLLKYFLSYEYKFPKVLERVFIFLLDRSAGVPISHGQDPVIRPHIHLLFTRGYNFFDTDINTVIALHLLDYFLYLGADPNEPDSKGNTPLALLCQLPFHADLDHKFYLGEAADKLLCGGADINTLWKAKNSAIYGIVAQVTTWKWGRDVYGWYFRSRHHRDCHLEYRELDGMTPLGRATAILFIAALST
ncbi:hypothetical protein MRS44_009324 [Fusarium solani]|uniref:uncharacterized protein n=1 Tax=Fusarium solani TaxID=169388 RepID=UPI0032C3ED81|nr:hypothetical protein MRS44_009324 [Fusarium solani]